MTVSGSWLAWLGHANFGNSMSVAGFVFGIGKKLFSGIIEVIDILIVE